MTLSLTRRRFLGASLVLCTIPARLFAADDRKVVLRFGAMSDVHYSGNPKIQEIVRFKKSLEFLNRYSSSQPYSKLDAVIVAGDMSNNGTENQIVPFKQHLDEGLKSGTVPLLCMGNHEFWGGSKTLWEKTFQTPANTHTAVNGYHFIGISPEKGTMRDGDYRYCLDWVRRELEKAAEDAPDKPIFVFQHYHITGTVYGTLPEDNSSGIKDLYDLFQEYPKIVNFSGHSHYPITDPRSAWQGVFSAFGTGTLSYFGMTPKEPGCSRRPPGAFNVGQFYVVEVHDDNSVILKSYDLITDSFYDTVYTIAEPGNLEKYLYTDARYEKTGKPEWSSDAAVTIDKPEPLGATFRFPQATDDEAVHSYRLTFQRQTDGDWKDDIEYHAWSNYFYRNMPETMDVGVYCLQPDSRYRVNVTALDCFKKESEKTLQGEFTTPKDPMAAPDQNDPRPSANVLNVFFTEQGAVNEPSSKDMRKPVETFGKPVFERDEALKIVVAEFGGKSDAVVIRFTPEDYAKMRRRISLGVRFRFEEFSTTRKTSDIFANTEHGGYSFAVNHQKKTLEFWFNVEGHYTILSAPITPGQYHTAYGTYNGRELVFYLNGKAIAKRSVAGAIHYPVPDAAKAFCVGADITHNGGTTNYFEGKIAFARVYGWTLNAEQVQNLSNG